jgi:RNA-directed DNA polymerase
VNTIRPEPTDELTSQWRSPAAPGSGPATRNAVALREVVRVVGDSMVGKGSAVNTGDLPGQVGASSPAEVRIAIVALKPGNSGGAKGGREGDSSNEGHREAPSASVPAADTQAEESLWQRHKAQRGVWSEKMLIALNKGVKGNVWFSLIDKIYVERTLGLAWEKVSANAGVCGVDGITVGHFGKDSQNRLLDAKEHLSKGTYKPKPVKRVMIPKPGSSEKRPLGIPTVRDRVVQTAVKMVIEPIFEREFAEQSYGFRPGRGCKDALRRVEKLLKSGLTHIVDVDIKAYFDSIPHERLMALVRERIADSRVLALIESFLKQRIMDPLGWIDPEEPDEGTPQGGVISPLLANIYLNPLDHLMSQLGYEMVRYADDMVILCPSAEAAQSALATLQEWSKEAGLTLHPEKTKIVDMGPLKAHFDFLGYRFWRSQKGGQLRRFIRPKSVRKFKANIKPLTKRANGNSLEWIVKLLRPKLVGFSGYFIHASADALESLDGWVRGRLRGILRKRAGLRGRGRGRDHKKWPNHYFTKLGLYSLATARAEEMKGLRKAVNS